VVEELECVDTDINKETNITPNRKGIAPSPSVRARKNTPQKMVVEEDGDDDKILDENKEVENDRGKDR